ncbi:S8/S53 family peptidase [Pseudomonas sp. NPDC089752]|uniref:S8/S53 family peptidase n=1 Tax=Pseudomonas sp. NPDC089752 TaxID=3364472 RepID=UPI003809FD51
MAFLSRLGAAGGRFDIVVNRGSAMGITGRIAASVNLVEDGARVLNWSWGVHRTDTFDREGGAIVNNVRSNLAMLGYERLLERYFHWLQRHHPDVVVVNSAGNSASTTDDHLPASLDFGQLLVVGGHQRNPLAQNVAEPGFAAPRDGSNRGERVDIYAATCPRQPRSTTRQVGKGGGCGTSYAAALVTGVVAAMISINPDLKPEQIRSLLKRSAWRLTSDHHREGKLARLNMYRALVLANESLREKDL